MTGLAMTRNTISEKRNHKTIVNPFNSEARRKRRFQRAMQAWPSAEALAIDLAERGVERSERMCGLYRSGKSLPPLWLVEILEEMSVEQTRQQIRALEQRLEEISGAS